MSQHSVKPWDMSAAHLRRGPLENDISTDVCVVGAGIAGLSTAYALAAEGVDVCVVDDGPIGGGETSNTTAHVTCALDDRYFELERIHSTEVATLAAESHAAAIDRIENVAAREGIACDFERVDGYLFLPPGEDPALLDRELEAVRRAGLVDVSRLEHLQLPKLDLGPCLRFPRQAQFFALSYLVGVAQAAERRGARIFTGAHMRTIRDLRDGLEIEIQGGARVRAKAAVVATNAPTVPTLTIDLKQAPYRTYVICAAIAPDSVPKALYWDTSDTPGNTQAAYHYVRLMRLPPPQFEDAGPRPPREYLIVGGEDHRTGQADDGDERWARLTAWANERFDVLDVVGRWSGQVMETADGLAYIGPHPRLDHVYIATGDSGMGMTHGTIASMLITDLIQGRDNPWAKIYDAGRSLLRASRTLAAENLKGLAQYADWIKPGDVGSIDEIPAGSGAVVRVGTHLLACYRDADGTLHQRSAVCPHMHGIIRWNANECSWDCPAHGSRFDPLGHPLNGPASSPLELVEADAKAT